MELLKEFSALCTPTLIYLVLAIIGSIGTLIVNPIFFIFEFIGIILWTYLMNALCRNGYTIIAWGFLLLPLFTRTLITR
jgi:hypothetical protein